MQPDFIIGSPPCTAFCSWNRHLNYKKMNKEDVRKMIDEGERHLKFMCQLYQKQIDAGRFFVHEHPATAVSWKEKDILRLAAQGGVHVTKVDQCRYGLKTKGKDGEVAPA